MTNVGITFCPMDFRAYIVRDPKTCGGEPVVRGTRVTVRTVLASLAEGATVDQILADFPTLTAEAVRAIIAFAATSAQEDIPVPALPRAG
jgi:uncharacterized protein (DUF433 family)